MFAKPLLTISSTMRTAAKLAPALIVALAAGCVSLPWKTASGVVVDGSGVAQAHAVWDNRVHIAADSVNNGVPQPGIAGRVFLFGPEFGAPLKGARGKVTVDMFDATNQTPGEQLPWMERWNFDPQTLQRLQQKDMIGWGSTLFLMSKSLKDKPDVTQVQLKLCFVPENAAPIYAPPAMVSLREGGAIPITQVQVPAAKR